MFFGVGVSCRILYSCVVYLYVNGSDSITSVGEERANLSAVVPVIMWFLFGEVSSSSGCLGWATFFIVALPDPSINYFANYIKFLVVSDFEALFK